MTGHLRELVLLLHVERRGRCAACSEVFPCPARRQAEGAS